MLNQYRRHTKKCSKHFSQHDRQQNSCKCMVYVEGKLDHGTDYIKSSTGTRSWELVRRMIVAAEQRGSWSTALRIDAVVDHVTIDGRATGQTIATGSAASGQTVAAAVDFFLAEAKSEKGTNIAAGTFGKYRTLLKRLKTFCSERGLIVLEEIKLVHLLAFKATWPTGPRATRNNIQRLRCFFRFCVNLKWVPESPAQAIQMPKNIKHTQKMPFTDEEMSRILQTAQTIKLHRQQSVNNLDLYGFILTMRYTGLRISDTGLSLVDRLHGNSLLLYAEKNGALVYCPLLPWVADVLKSIPPKQGKYLFCTGSTRLETVVELWSKRLRQVFKAAGVENATSHRFRHTFAVNLLESGVNVKNVSMLLGHESVLTTEQHYSAWIQSRQEALNADVLGAYQKSSQLKQPAKQEKLKSGSDDRTCKFDSANLLPQENAIRTSAHR